MKQAINSIRNDVEYCLATDNKCRINDKWLIFQVLKLRGWDFDFSFEDVIKFPTFESITRVRRKLQEEGKYLNEDLDIHNERLEKEQEMRGINNWW